MDKRIQNFSDAEREMRRFLERDPIPKLTEAEVSALSERVLRGERVSRKMMWFELRPAFKAALGVAAVLVAMLVGLLVQSVPDMIVVEAPKYGDELYEKYGAEDVLVKAISAGDVDMQFALTILINVPAGEIAEAYEDYRSTDVNSKIDGLTDEEAAEILKIMDEMGYPDRET
ncbi:MAG TPA: hypothetical protein ENN07_02575 [candidate division Zixibacteria bacterium]|nr:hypothetical protein [candidate division Zixibacteria bacterium]